MTCPEFEVLLADYLDGTLDADQKQALEQHRDTCATCAELARDVAGALSFIERAADVTVPPELLTRIAYEIPTGGQRADRRESIWAGLRRRFQPVLQPKFAMGMAMTILSFSLLGRALGIEVRQLKPADLTPTAVWAATEDRVHKSWERAVKYYEGLKVVWEVQSRLKEWTEQEDERPQAGKQTQPGANKTKPAPNDSTQRKGEQ
jgi:Putative zinc-finger